MVATAKFFQGEARHLSIKLTLNGRALDLTGYTLALTVKKHPDDDVPLVNKVDADFYKSYAGQGVVSVLFSPPDLNVEAGVYQAQLKVVDPQGEIRKTDPFDLEIEKALDITRLLQSDVAVLSAAPEITLTVT